VLRSRLVAVDTPAALRARLFERRVRVILATPAQRFAQALQASGIDNARVEGMAISIGLHGRITTPAIVRRLVEAGGEIESVAVEEPSLEDVYLKLLQEDGGPA